MNISGLQQHFSNLASLLRNAQAAKLADELEKVRDGLAPFHSMSVKDFADFLVRAEEFARTGHVSTAPTKSRARSPGATTKASKAKPDLNALIQETKALFERAGQGKVSDDEVEALGARLTPLTKDSLGDIGNAIQIVFKKTAKKDEIVAEIKRTISERNGTILRSGMIHPRPDTESDHSRTSVPSAPDSATA